MSGAEVPLAMTLAPDLLGAGAAGGAAAGMASAAPGIAGLFGPAAGGLGASLVAPAAAGVPLGMASAAPGVAGLFGAAAPGIAAGDSSVNPALLGRLGMGMMQGAMKQPQPSPMLGQRPPSMQQQQPQGMPAPAMNQPAVPTAPGQAPGMAMQGMQAPGGMQDILRRLGMMQ